MKDRFARIRVSGLDTVAAEVVAGRAWESGASGIVEEDEPVRAGEPAPRHALEVHAPAAAGPALYAALRDALPADAALGPLELPDAERWEESWKQHLRAVVVSPRLVVKPPFAAEPPRPAGSPPPAVLEIDPGQAFGTGGHASTRLALAGLDAWIASMPRPPERVLDVGTGSGVLALAALALGAGRAVGLDLDPLAAPAARAAARRNALAARFAAFTGPLDALAPGSFDLVLANLLRDELLPIAAGLAARVAPGGALVLAGLLERDADTVIGRLMPQGLEPLPAQRREECDAGAGPGEAWLGLVLRRPR